MALVNSRSVDLNKAIAKAYKPWWIPWKSIVTKFYKFMLDKTGEAFLKGEEVK